MKISLQGARDLDRALSDLTRAAAKGVARRALKKAAEPMRAAAEGDAPVSYTHLDVYKRQAYKRALWIVVLLNIGYGVVEIVGSFLAGSQALQADALDFVGDGLILSLIHI